MTSRLAEMQARFQQKQIQDREEKLLRLYENQQQRAFERVSRGSAGSTGSLGSTNSSTGGGKVRQMFDERRQRAGVDRSYPLEPLKSPQKSGAKSTTTSRTVVKSTTTSVVRNGNSNKPAVVTTSRSKEVKSFSNSFHNNNDLVYDVVDNSRISRDLAEIMGDQLNLNGNDGDLDSEEMPYFEEDKGFAAGKLANVGGKLPSEVVASVKKTPVVSNRNTVLGKTFKKETKPIVRRTVKPVPTSSSSSPSQQLQQQPAKATSSTPSMLKKTPQPSAQSGGRTPSAGRPSAKQAAKSAVVRDDLNECRFCGRRFAADRLDVHEEICGRTAKKKRRVYDATKHRVEGTELAPYVVRKGGAGKNLSAKTSNKPSTGKKDWRKTHEEFINAIRSAKAAQAHVAKGGKLADLPPPPPSSNPDYIQCPHCGRKFNESAAERHIPKCASYQFNKPKAPPPRRK